MSAIITTEGLRHELRVRRAATQSNLDRCAVQNSEKFTHSSEKNFKNAETVNCVNYKWELTVSITTNNQKEDNLQSIIYISP